jgi:hypothetical protein
VDPSLPAHVAEVIVDLPEARSLAENGVVTWSRAGNAFASLGATGIEIRLDRQIAGAAARTPDVTLSGRGPEWIHFAPAELDPHALDRLEAWLELAYRRAVE